MQHGFRARLVTLINDLSSSLDRGDQTDMVILDFSKAFDRVPHKRLLRKLHHYGIRGHLHSWITSFLTGKSQMVIVEGSESESAPVISGVIQGSVLDPLLFLLFINDLPDNIGSNTRLFADDCYRLPHYQRPCRPRGTTRRSCQIGRMGRQVGHGISPPKVQYPERH